MPKEIEKNSKNDDFVSENIILARLRTLFALERNYLAEERTRLAQLRTGFSIILFAPPLAALYISFKDNLNFSMPINVSIFTVFIVIVIFGLFWVFSAYRHLYPLRQKMKHLNKQEIEIINSNHAVQNLLETSFIFDKKVEK